MDWHRHFGLLLTDFFAGSPFVVELEKDLSLKQQFLDVVVIRKRKGRLAARLPDGLDDLGRPQFDHIQVPSRNARRLDLKGTYGPLRQLSQAGHLWWR
jgi:hypothetical protein